MCELQQPALLTSSPLLLRIPLAASRTLGKIKPVETIGQANSILIESHRSHLPAKFAARRLVPPRHLCFAKTKWRHFQEQPQHGAQRSSRGQHTLVCSAAFQRTHHQTLDTTSTVFFTVICVGCGTVAGRKFALTAMWRRRSAALQLVWVLACPAPPRRYRRALELCGCLSCSTSTGQTTERLTFYWAPDGRRRAGRAASGTVPASAGIDSRSRAQYAHQRAGSRKQDTYNTILEWTLHPGTKRTETT